MPSRYYANGQAKTLNGAITNVATSIVVNNVTGLPTSFPYTIVIDRGSALEDVMDVTNAAGTTLTVTRSVDGYTGQAHSNGARVEHVTTARDYTEFQTKLDATVNLTGSQTITGAKTYTAQAYFDHQINARNNAVFSSTTNASAGTTTVNSTPLLFQGKRWDGAASQVQQVSLSLIQVSAANGDNYAYLNGSELRVSGATGSSLTGAWHRFVGGTASGAPSSGTYKVGDFVTTMNGKVFVCTVAGTPGTWVDAGAAPANMVTTDTVQTITANKTFQGNLTLVGNLTHDGSGFLTGDASPIGRYYFRRPTGSSMGNPTVAIVKQSTQTGDLLQFYNESNVLTSYVQTDGAIFDKGNRVYSAGHTVPIAGLSATGTPSSTTFLRGDNTWGTALTAAPANMATTDTTQTITGVKTFTTDISLNHDITERTIGIWNQGHGGYLNLRAEYMQIGARTATASATENDAWIEFKPTYWTGAVSSRPSMYLYGDANAGTPYFEFSHPVYSLDVYNGVDVTSAQYDPVVSIRDTGTGDYNAGAQTWLYPGFGQFYAPPSDVSNQEKESYLSFQASRWTGSANENMTGSVFFRNTTADGPHFDFNRPVRESGGRVYSPANGVRIVIPHTFTISGEVKVNTGNNYIPPFFVHCPTGQAAKVIAIEHVIDSGTSVGLNLVRADAGGSNTYVISSPSVTTTATFTDVTDVVVGNQQRLYITVTSVSGTPKDMSFSVFVEYTYTGS